MTSLTVFSFEGQEVRTAGSWDKPEFVARDIIAVLYPDMDERNYSNMLSKIPSQWKGHSLVMTLGGEQKLTTLFEQGFYWIVARSDSSIAFPFQEWLFSDVLPQIRKTGKYAGAMPDGIMTEAQLEIYGRQLQKSGAIYNPVEKAKYATEVSKTYAYLTGTQPIDYTLAQSQALKAVKSEHQVLLDKIVERAKQLNRPITARDVTRNFHAFRKVPSTEIRKMFQHLADTGVGSVESRGKDLKYVHSDLV